MLTVDHIHSATGFALAAAAAAAAAADATG